MSAATLDLVVSVKGEITKSNFEDFAKLATSRIESLNFSLTTDEEFGQAESDIKGLAQFEKTLSITEDEVLKQMDDVYSLITGIKGLKQSSSHARLKLKKEVDSQKKIVRFQIHRDAVGLISIDHPGAAQMIETAMKGKRTLTSLKSAATKAAEEIEEGVENCRVIVDFHREKNGSDIVHGENELLTMDSDALRIELERRIERREADRKAEKLRLEAQQLRKIEADRIAAEKAEAQRCRVELDEIAAKQASEAKDKEFALKTPMFEKPKAPDPEPESKPDQENETQQQELARFIEMFGPAFAPIRAARLEFKHAENIKAGEQFAADFGAAHQALKGGLK